MNYHMLGAEKSLEELHEMLKTAESFLKGVSHNLAINEGGKKINKKKKKKARPRLKEKNKKKVVVEKHVVVHEKKSQDQDIF